MEIVASYLPFPFLVFMVPGAGQIIYRSMQQDHDYDYLRGVWRNYWLDLGQIHGDFGSQLVPVFHRGGANPPLAVDAAAKCYVNHAARLSWSVGHRNANL